MSIMASPEEGFFFDLAPDPKSLAIKLALPLRLAMHIHVVPSTKPRLLSRLRLKRNTKPSLAHIFKVDLVVGSQSYPVARSEAVIPSMVNAAVHISSVPRLVLVSQVNT